MIYFDELSLDSLKVDEFIKNINKYRTKIKNSKKLQKKIIDRLKIIKNADQFRDDASYCLAVFSLDFLTNKNSYLKQIKELELLAKNKNNAAVVKLITIYAGRAGERLNFMKNASKLNLLISANNENYNRGVMIIIGSVLDFYKLDDLSSEYKSKCLAMYNRIAILPVIVFVILPVIIILLIAYFLYMF